MIDTILFDFGNVLGRFCHETACEKLAVYTNVNAEKLYLDLCKGQVASWRQTGAMDANDFYDLVRSNYALNSSITYEVFSDIWGDIFTPAPPEVLSILRKIREDVTCCIASNTEQLHWPFIAKLDTVKSFNTDLIFRSYELEEEKPSKEFFLRILQQIGKKPEDAIFIDDVEDYVEVFKKLGGQAVRFDLRQDKPILLENILQNVGVLEI